MLPTSAKFYSVFNMRDLSRVFHGVLLTPKESITEGGLRAKQGKLINFSPQNMLIGLWKHECDRVFCDKLTTNKDKESYSNFVEKIGSDVFRDDLYRSACREKFLWSAFYATIFMTKMRF